MILIYTFKTFPWKEDLQEIFMPTHRVCKAKLFVFGKLKEDFERFCRVVETEKLDWIIGIAKGRKTTWEGLAVNQFNQGKIIKGGVEKYDLYIPDESVFPIHETAWTTFCNWTAYKIQNYLLETSMKSKHSFIHIYRKDFELVSWDILFRHSLAQAYNKSVID